MSNSFIKIKGSFKGIFDSAEDGTTRVLMKNEVRNTKLKSSIVMIKFTKRQWNKLKDLENISEEKFQIEGEVQACVNKMNKPYLYVQCSQLAREKRLSGTKSVKRMIPYNFDIVTVNWVKEIPNIDLVEIDINKVKLNEEIHLNSIGTNFNIKEMVNKKELNPIAVKVSGDGYTLISGLRTYIVAKLLSIKVKAYITELDIDDFRDKYM